MFDFLSNKFSSIFSKITGKGKLTESDVDQVLDQVKDALIEADVPLAWFKPFAMILKKK